MRRAAPCSTRLCLVGWATPGGVAHVICHGYPWSYPPQRGAEGRAEEAAEGKEEEDDDDEDSEEGYVSPKDPFPCEARRRPTEEDFGQGF